MSARCFGVSGLAIGRTVRFDFFRMLKIISSQQSTQKVCTPEVEAQVKLVRIRP